MTTWIEPPPPQKRMGCFAKGCLILCVFFIFLGVAFVGGTYMAIRYLRSEYFPTTAVELPAASPTEPEQQAALGRWQTFENHARAHQAARIEMTADELNALVASESFLRGKVHVTLDGDVAHLKVSIPLEQVRWLAGHYMNGEATVQSGATGDPGDVRITNVMVNGRSVADEAMQWQYGPWSVRRYINDWSADQNLKTFEIRDGRVILETKGE
jgi:hypothetical protein